MKTFLAQNKFNSDVHVPETSGSAAADSCPEPRAAAAQVSDGVGAKPILASSPSEAVTVSVRAQVAADLNSVSDGVSWSSLDLEMWPTVTLARAPSETEGAVSRAASSDNLADDLAQLLGVARKLPRLRLALPRFAPDYESMQAAVHDPNAPRALETDPVWADPPPKFLLRVR